MVDVDGTERVASPPAQAARQCVAVTPYRLAADVATDSLTIEPCPRPATLTALSPSTQAVAARFGAPRARQLATTLKDTLQRAARAGTTEQPWTWLQNESGREHLVTTGTSCEAPPHRTRTGP